MQWWQVKRVQKQLYSLLVEELPTNMHFFLYYQVCSEGQFFIFLDVV